MFNIRNFIIKFYIDSKETIKPKIPHLFKKISNEMPFLGDNLDISRVFALSRMQNKNIDVFVKCQKFDELKELIPFASSDVRTFDELTEFVFNYFFLLETYNCGNGHLINRLERILGLQTINKPSSFLNIKSEKIKGRIGLQLDSTELYRELSPRYLNIISEFIRKNNNKYEFVSFGYSDQTIPGINIRYIKQNLVNSLKMLSTCEYFIGLNSGFIAATSAFGVKSIILLNYPPVYRVVLPILKDCVDWTLCENKFFELNHLFPQDVHLHTKGENPLVPQLSIKSLEAAIDGSVYPFWQDDYIDLISEKIC